jgi:hypothetical protein
MALNEDWCEFSAEIVPLYDGIMVIFVLFSVSLKFVIGQGTLLGGSFHLGQNEIFDEHGHIL